ncbi:MAG: serine/threonine protein kinase [Lentisphaeraceae bacterium]|nr:serine/threonine protein kinase [Lentisphaeraceae bacterium]
MKSNDSIKVRKIGKYILQRQIGQGSMGTVWLSHHMGLDVPVAVKLLRSSLVEEDPEYVERFIQEGNLAAKVNHKNIVRIYDAGHEGKTYYMVMEYIDGGNILELIAEVGRLTPEAVVDYAIILADALIEAHELGVIHRDIKPENIMLTKDGKVKLADLGLAKYVDNEYSSTLTGTAIGTPNYMSPEQTRNAKAADLRTDIYSLGASLYHMLTGEVPFKGDSSIDIMMKHCSEELIPPNKICETIPERLSQIVCKMMEKLPEDRFASCEDLFKELNSYKYRNEDKSRSISKTQINLKGVSLEEIKERRAHKHREESKKKGFTLRSLSTLALAAIILIPAIILLGKSAGDTQASLEGKLVNKPILNKENKKSIKKPAIPSKVLNKTEPNKLVDLDTNLIPKKLIEENQTQTIETPKESPEHINKFPDLKFSSKHASNFTLENKKLIIHKESMNKYSLISTKSTYTDYKFFINYNWLKTNSSFKFTLFRDEGSFVDILLSTGDKGFKSGTVLFRKFEYSTAEGNYIEKNTQTRSKALTPKNKLEMPFGERNLLVVHKRGDLIRVLLNHTEICRFRASIKESRISLSLWNSCHVQINKFAYDIP